MLFPRVAAGAVLAGISFKARSSVLSHLVPWKFGKTLAPSEGLSSARWPLTQETRDLPRDPGSRRAPGSGSVGRTRGFLTPRLSWRGGGARWSMARFLLCSQSGLGLSQHSCPGPTALLGGAAAAVQLPGTVSLPPQAGGQESHIGRRWPKPPVKLGSRAK